MRLFRRTAAAGDNGGPVDGDGRGAAVEAPAERKNPSTEFLYANKWRIFGVMMIGWAMSLLDVSIVNVSIPELQDEMSTDISTVTWVINAYNIIFAVLLVSMGRLADQFGRRKFFVIGLTVFTIGSALCAISWSVEWLIVFRVIQGAGAGILAPLGFAMTVLVFPPEQRGRGLALIAVVALVSSAIGPVVGGVLVEIASWHWIFLINIPFGIIGVILCLRWWPETWDLNAGREVDVQGDAAARRRGLHVHRRADGGQPVRRRPAALAQPDAGGDPARSAVRVVGAARAEPDDHAGAVRKPPVPERQHRDAVLRRRARSARCSCSRCCS